MFDVYAQCSSFRDCIDRIGRPGGLSPRFREDNFITELVNAFLPAVLTIAGFVAVIMIIISGIQFITSSGNPEAAAGAKGRLTFSIVGFVVIVIAFLILQIIDRVFLSSGVV